MLKIESIHGTILVEKQEDPPNAIIAFINNGKSADVDDPYDSFNAELFVRMAVLSDELKDRIREEIGVLDVQPDKQG